MIARGGVPSSPGWCLEQVMRRAEQQPTTVAVVCDGNSLTYEALLDAARGVQVAIAEAQILPGEIIGLSTLRNSGYVAGILGIWLSGCAFAPIDQMESTARNARALSSAGARILLEIKGTDQVILHDIADDSSPRPMTAQESRARTQVATNAGVDLAYVLFTSGTTGTPKGVPISHAGLANTMQAFSREADLVSPSACLALSSLSFDASIFEIILGLVCGLTVILASSDERMDPDAISRLIDKHDVGWFLATPTWLRLLVLVRPDCLAGVLVLSVGEALSQELARTLTSCGARVWNGYGPTETAIICAFHKYTESDTAWVPIGRAVHGMICEVLDESGHVLEGVSTGQLRVTGPGVTPGYLDGAGSTLLPAGLIDSHRSYDTGDVVTRDLDGLLVYQGRRDNQVKVRGQRLQLEEIEAIATSRFKSEIFGAVLLPGEQIILAIQGKEWSANRERDLKENLAKELPSYMCPRRIIYVKDWPLSDSQKTDRRRLQSIAQSEVLSINKRTQEK